MKIKISNDPNVNWRNNAIQFPRLIEELQGIGVFSPEVIQELATTMDCPTSDIESLLERARKQWEQIKSEI